MEYGLGRERQRVINEANAVLILVVMEYGLGPTWR